VRAPGRAQGTLGPDQPAPLEPEHPAGRLRAVRARPRWVSTPCPGHEEGTHMGMTGTMRGYGSTARFKAEAAGHRMKDRMLEKSLDSSSQEAERLRLGKQMLGGGA